MTRNDESQLDLTIDQFFDTQVSPGADPMNEAHMRAFLENGALTGQAKPKSSTTAMRHQKQDRDAMKVLLKLCSPFLFLFIGVPIILFMLSSGTVVADIFFGALVLVALTKIWGRVDNYLNRYRIAALRRKRRNR